MLTVLRSGIRLLANYSDATALLSLCTTGRQGWRPELFFFFFNTKVFKVDKWAKKMACKLNFPCAFGCFATWRLKILPCGSASCLRPAFLGAWVPREDRNADIIRNEARTLVCALWLLWKVRVLRARSILSAVLPGSAVQARDYAHKRAYLSTNTWTHKHLCVCSCVKKNIYTYI